MEAIEHGVLIFWFETPPKVSKGAFNYVTRNWGNQVYYICYNDYPEYRKKINWNDGDFGSAKVCILSEQKDPDEIIEKMFSENPNAIHVLPGFDNIIERKLRPYTLTGKYRFIAFSERPVTMGNYFELRLRKIYFQYKYRKLHKLLDPYISAFLPLGEKGVDTFAAYGWSRNKMYPFMYNPVNNKDQSIVTKKRDAGTPIRFLYIGRFYFKTKGIDTLLKATYGLEGDWGLDLVGGYGKQASQVIRWVEAHPNIRYLGSWQSKDVCNKITDYDVVVIPSKYDGWNLLVNEAINAHTGVITTDQAVSDEIITASGAGMVIPANNPSAMRKAMQQVIDNPETVWEWKKKAAAFSDRISPETVGKYLIQILENSIYHIGGHPQCPWL